ncbi:related to Mediator of RNA polymerase II transcription subunit 9 [Zygosaccharomyces bailii]|nr:related to Mediator of RNA polymerase II transcription subunit 9 [Zygosaccharomyces bailii]
MLQNEGLRQVHAMLVPEQEQGTQSSEFIPHLFYSLYQIRKDPSNANQLENSTGFIRHRLKNCKSLIANNEECRNLLSKSAEEWQEHIRSREKELMVKRKMLDDLGKRLEQLKNP